MIERLVKVATANEDGVESEIRLAHDGLRPCLRRPRVFRLREPLEPASGGAVVAHAGPFIAGVHDGPLRTVLELIRPLLAR